MKKKVELIKNTIYVYGKNLTEEELKKVLDYALDLDMEGNAKVFEFKEMLVIKVSKYSELEPNEVYADILKLLS